MGIINVYKRLTSERRAIRHNGKLSDAIEIFDIDLKNCVMISRGERVSGDYIVSDDDVVFVRELPGDTGNTGLNIFLTAITGGVYGIFWAIDAANKEKERQANEEAARQQKMAKDKAAKNETSPFLRGAKNKNAMGNVIPFLMGESYLTPFTVTGNGGSSNMGGGFYTLEGARGEKQYYNTVMCLGYSSMVLKEFQIGNTTVVNFGGYSYNSGGGTQTVYNKAGLYHNGVYVGDDAAAKMELLRYIHSKYNPFSIAGSVETMLDDIHYYNDYSWEWREESTSSVTNTGQTITVSREIGEPQNGVYEFDKGTSYYDEKNMLEVRQGGDFSLFEFNHAVKSQHCNMSIVNDANDDAPPDVETPVVQADDNPMKVEVCIQFNGLRQYAEVEDGYWEERTVEVVPEWSNDGGNNWKMFYFSQNGRRSNVFTYNAKNQIRFIATLDLTYGDVMNDDGSPKSIQIRCRKVTRKPTDMATNEACYLLYINTWQYDVRASMANKTLVAAKSCEWDVVKKTVMAAVRVAASENTEGLMDEMHFIATGLARTWDGFKWSEKKYPTSNPAAWLLEIMTSDRHNLSKFLDSEIDMESFGEAYEYCESEGFRCDGGITKEVKKRDLLQKILKLFNASLYRDRFGLYKIAIDKKEPLPVALINPQDVTDIKVTKDFSRKPDGLKVSFTDRKAWTTDTRYVMLDGKDYKTDDQTVKETAYEYCADATHAWKLAQRELRRQVLQPRELTVEVGAEGDYYPLYSTVKLQARQLKIGLAESVVHGVTLSKSNRITAIEIGDLFEFEQGKRYGAIIQAQTRGGRELLHVEVTGEGKTRHLRLVDSYWANVIPEYGNIVSIGYLDEAGDFDRVTNVMKIYDIKPNGNGFTLTLRDYNDELYEYGDIPAYRSNLTSTPIGSAAQLPDIALDMATEQVHYDPIAQIEAALKKEKEPYAYMEQYSHIFYVDFDQNPEDVYLKVPIHVLKGVRNIPFLLGKIIEPEGISVTEYLDNTGHGILIRTIPSGIVDENGLEKNIPIHNGYFEVPIIYGKDFAWTVYGRSGNAIGRDDYAVGRIPPEGDHLRTVFRFTYSTTRAGVYRGTKNRIDGYLSPDADERRKSGLHIGDYFTWTGATAKAEYNGREIFFEMARVYRWNGVFWQIDESNEHNGTAFNDILEFSDKKTTEANTKVAEMLQRLGAKEDLAEELAANRVLCHELVANEAFFGTLSASVAFIQRLVSRDAFIDNLFVHEITMPTKKDEFGKDTGGFIQSNNFNANNMKGFRISYDGVAEFYQLIVSGKTSLRGDTIAANSLLVVPQNNSASAVKDMFNDSQTQKTFALDTKNLNSEINKIFARTLWVDGNNRLWLGNDPVIMGSDLQRIFTTDGVNVHINTNQSGYR